MNTHIYIVHARIDFSPFLCALIIFSDLPDPGATVLVLLFYSWPRTVLIFYDLILFSYQLSLSGVVCVINKLSTNYTINVYTASQSILHVLFSVCHLLLSKDLSRVSEASFQLCTVSIYYQELVLFLQKQIKQIRFLWVIMIMLLIIILI